MKVDEAGKVLSAKNEGMLRQIQTMLTNFLKGASPKAEAVPAKGKAKTGAAAMAESLQEAGVMGPSFAEIAAMVRDAIEETTGAPYIYIRDMFPDSVVYTLGWDGELVRCPYTLTDGCVALGTPEEVDAITIYVPEGCEDGACPYCGGAMGATGAMPDAPAPVPSPAPDAPPAAMVEAATIRGDIVPLAEAAVASDGTAKIKLIAPGWGSSGYYAAEVLKRDGPTVFPKGTKMYWDHPTATDEAERPERSLRDLAAELTSDAAWADDPAHGPGLYADTVVFPAFQETVNALAPHIGTSIRALGRAEAGSAEGRSGTVITQLVAGKSVDFVTTPGAGGKVLSLFEAARGGRPTPTHVAEAPAHKEEPIVTEEEAKALREANAQLSTQVARLLERETLREAASLAASVLRDPQRAGADLPAPTIARLTESLARRPALAADGTLDRAAFETAVKEAAQAEATYLATLSEGGQIVGMGSTSQPTAPTLDATQARLDESFRALGLSATGAKIAASGR